jgi:SNF2 family DNA or RNA helicase
MGTGKTMTTLSLIMGGKHDLGFIVCPKSVIDVWPLEFFRNSKKDFHILQRGKESISKFVKNIEKERHNAQVYKRPFVFILNYEAMWRADLADYIENNEFDYIVYDEAHRLKAVSGSASKFAAKIRPNAARIIAGTGTLLPHSPLDAFGIYRAIDPGVFGQNYLQFKARYAVMGGFEGKQVVRFQNQEELHRKLKSISFRIKTEDAVELPEAQHIERFCELSPATRKIYEKMKEDMLVEFGEHTLEAANAMVKVLRLMQCTSGVMRDVDGKDVRVGSEKAELFADILEDVPKEEPVVVFCNFTSDLRAVEEACQKESRRVAELSGRKNELKLWQDGEADVLIVQIKAGKEGVDFTRARVCFYYSIGHSRGEYLQSERRIHRPGQTRSVVYYHLLAKNTIDTDVYRALDKKQDIVLSVLDGLGIKPLEEQ